MNPSKSLLIALPLLFGCQDPSTDDPTVDVEGFNYEDVELPAHFDVAGGGAMGGASANSIDNTPDSNPITNQGASLGRVLFYDKSLSANGTIACASCHKAAEGFSDDRTLSLGFDGGETGRHSMGLTNARFYAPGMFFWDQRAATLEDQVLMPFQDPVEMGMTLETLVAAVESNDVYPELFEASFGDSSVSSERVSLALAQFVRSMVSFESRYDEGRIEVSSSTVDFPNFSEQENLGKRIFMNMPMFPDGAGCVACHQGETMSAVRAENNGLEADSEDDQGYGGVTGRAGDMGTFKVPSLRNIGVRASFMRDGRFTTLRQVVDHYADSVQPHPNLGMPLNMRPISLDETQRTALVAFLHTLTDDTMLADPKFSDPFE